MMQEMFERISGYDYRAEVHSHVTKCSFGSYKEICEGNSSLVLFRKSGDSDDERQQRQTLIQNATRGDRGTAYRRAQLQLTAFHALVMHRLQSQNQRNLRNQKSYVSERHPFYLVALLKKRCGTLRQFLAAPQSLLDKQQIKLETLFKSLSIHHRRLKNALPP